MDIVLIDSKISGIKNLEKDIHLSFTKKIFGKEIFNQSCVKAIYGSNGAGKSGIAHAYDIFRELVLNDFPFSDPLFTPKFCQLINKKSKTFSISNTFAINIDEKIYRVRYSVSVGMDVAMNLSFKSEKVELLNSRLDNPTTIVEVKDGVIANDVIDQSIQFIKQPESLLRKSSVLRSVLGKEFDQTSTSAIALYSTLMLAMFINVSYGSIDDSHETFDCKSLLNSFEDGKFTTDKLSKALTLDSLVQRLQGEHYVWIIDRKEEKQYKELTKQLASFIKLLKPSLKDIEIKFKHDSVASYCNLRFFYKDYDVDYEFESTGIKKLCILFSALYNASKGRITFIDEIDSGIHDVFLTKLIEYFALYNDCQLIITTHHVGLMEVVKHLRKSIDILDDDGTIRTWVKNGKYSPSSLYSKGYLRGVPFNLQSSDFAYIFGEDK